MKSFLAIRSAISGDSTELLAYQLDRATDQLQADTEEYSEYSIFPDGTFFGVLWNSKSVAFKRHARF
jgi:hypothetical protein